MDDTGISVIGSDRAAVERLVALLEFVGEPIAAGAAGDVAVLLPHGDGTWPVPPESTATVILAGGGEPPEGVRVLGRLQEPYRLAPMMDCLGRIHGDRRERRMTGNGACTGFDLPGKFHDAPGVEVAAGLALDWDVADPRAPALLPADGLDLKDYLGRLERRLIEQALKDANSVVARAAERLHIRRTTLVEKMRKYGIERV